jgi:hypothetical protein
VGRPPLHTWSPEFEGALLDSVDGGGDAGKVGLLQSGAGQEHVAREGERRVAAASGLLEDGRPVGQD